MCRSAFGELVVIANPNAGGGRVRRRLPELERALAMRGLPYVLHVTGGPEEATAAAEEALRAGGRFVVAVGGDGTVQQVLNGLFSDGRTLVERPVLGVVGAGTGGDLLRTFGLPDDVERAVGHLAGANVYELDVMKVTSSGPDGERATRYAHDLARAGLGGTVSLRTGRLPAWVGRARPFLGFWLALAQTTPTEVRVESDQKTYQAYGGIPVQPISFVIDRSGTVGRVLWGAFPGGAFDHAVTPFLTARDGD